MASYYKHTQSGVLLASVFFAVALILALLGTFIGWNIISAAVFGVILLSILLFYNLTVEINEEFISLSFGIGWIRKRFLLREVAQAYPVRNPLYAGWGIHMLMNGTWLFNVSGREGVEIVMTTGKRYRIGSDEPVELARAIMTAKEMSQPDPDAIV